MVDTYYNVTITGQQYTCSEFHVVKKAKAVVDDDCPFLTKVAEAPCLKTRSNSEWTKRDAISDTQHPEQVGKNPNQKKDDIAYTILKNIEKILSDPKIKKTEDKTTFVVEKALSAIDLHNADRSDLRSIVETRRLVHIAKSIKENYGNAYDNFRIICPTCWLIQGLLSVLTFGLFKTRKQRVDAVFKKIERLQFQNYYEPMPTFSSDAPPGKVFTIKSKSEVKHTSHTSALLSLVSMFGVLSNAVRYTSDQQKEFREIAEQIKDNYEVKYKQLSWIRRVFIRLTCGKPELEKVREAFQRIVNKTESAYAT